MVFSGKIVYFSTILQVYLQYIYKNEEKIKLQAAVLLTFLFFS